MSELRTIDDHAPVLRVARAGAAALVALAVIRQLFIVADHPEANPADLFSFFTIQANVLAAAVWAAGAWNPAWAKRHPLLRGGAVTYLVICAVVYVVLSFGQNKDEYLTLTAWWVDALTHQVLPLAAVLEWILVPPRRTIAARAALAWLLYPVVYFVLTLLRGLFSGWYPYAFLQPGYWGGYSGVFLNALIVLAIMVPIALAVGAVGSRRSRHVLAATDDDPAEPPPAPASSPPPADV